MTATPSPIRRGSTVRVVDGMHRGATGKVVGFDPDPFRHPFLVELDGDVFPPHQYRFGAYELEMLVERTIGDEQTTGPQPKPRGVSSQAGLASLRGGVGAETVTEPAPAPDCRMCDWRWQGTRSSANLAKAIEIHVRATGHDPEGDPIPLPIHRARQALTNANAAWEDAALAANDDTLWKD